MGLVSKRRGGVSKQDGEVVDGEDGHSNSVGRGIEKRGNGS